MDGTYLMNKTAVFITFAVLAALGLIGAIYLMVERPDATATFTALLVQILGLVAVAAGTFYGLGKANEKLEEVKTQTNGNLHRRDQEIERLTRENIELARQLNPTGPVPTSEDPEHGR